MRILVIGNKTGTNIGGCFARAASELNIEALVAETRLAMEAPAFIRWVNWHVRGRRPTWLNRFGTHVFEACKRWRPQYIIAVGIAPVTKDILKKISTLGIQRVNYLTDDPWNVSHKTSWFIETLAHYDHIFSPRKANIEDIKKTGCPNVSYLPFAYAPELHFPEVAPTPGDKLTYESDIVFVGSGDRDRAAYIRALIKAGFKLALYGSFWERFRYISRHTKGQADPQVMRRAIGGARVALCLVRRANRDGNCMRTFEIPAIGACMLTEDTEEHREIFGREGENVLYFKGIDEMVEHTKFLVGNETECKRLAGNAHNLIVRGSNTYRDRLMAILENAKCAVS